MSNEEALVRYEEIVKQAADEWRSIYLNIENFEPGNNKVVDQVISNVKKRMEAALMEGLESYAVERMRSLDGEAAQKIADYMLDKWIRSGEIEVNEPSDSVAESINNALDRLQLRSRVFAQSARQKKIEALAMHEEKVPAGQIAKAFGVTTRTAQTWIKEEKEELEDLKKMLAIYGYKAVRE